MTISIKEYLRTDYIKTSLLINYENGKIISAYLQNYELGIIEYKNNEIKANRWENEDQARSINNINNRYPCLLSNGIEKSIKIQKEILMKVEELIKKENEQKKIEPSNFIIINECINSIKQLIK
jgi:hypothetical protein